MLMKYLLLCQIQLFHMKVQYTPPIPGIHPAPYFRRSGGPSRTAVIKQPPVRCTREGRDRNSPPILCGIRQGTCVSLYSIAVYGNLLHGRPNPSSAGSFTADATAANGLRALRYIMLVKPMPLFIPYYSNAFRSSVSFSTLA